jgi:Na+/H+-dicarboxylate symporter
MKLWKKILIAMGLGIIAGLIFGESATQIQWIGDIFLSLINMIIVLLVLSSMTVGITSIHDPQKLGRVGIKTLLIYLSTTVIAIVIGLCFASFFKPGTHLHLIQTGVLGLQEAPPLKEILLNIVPSNPMESLVKGEVLQIIVFSLFLGISINFAGEKGKPLLEFMESLADVMYRLTSIVMEFSPIGVFAIMAALVGKHGLIGLAPLAEFLILYYVACGVHILFIFCTMLWFFARLHPGPFFRGMGDAFMVAFSTSSSSAALPVSMHCVQQNLGVSKNITRFVLPLGSTVNMNGAAIYQGMSVMFLAQAYGIELGWQQLLTIIATATLSAVGAAGIPGSGYLMLKVVFGSVGLQAGEGLLLLAGIDRVREMVSTVLNVMGDAVTAVLVAKQEGELDERQYYHEELVELEGGEV